MRELLGCRVASATISSLRDHRALCFRRPARAMLAGGHPGQPTRLHARCRSQARSSAVRIPCSPCARSGRVFNPPCVATKTKKPTAGVSFLVLLVETAGIGHPRQPTRLHARCRSQARSSAARIPCSPRARPGRVFNCPCVATKTKKPTAGVSFLVLLGRRLPKNTPKAA